MKNLAKLLIISSIITCVCVGTQAQRDRLLGITNWNEDLEINWSDFQGTSLNDSVSPIYMDVRMGYRPLSTANVLVTNAIESQAYMLNQTSYVAESYRSLEVLYYLQTYFDLAGLYSLEYRNRLIRSGQTRFWNYNNRAIIDDVINSEWKHDIDLLASESEYGAITESPWSVNLGLGIHFLRLKETIGEDDQFLQFSEPTLTYFNMLGGYDLLENNYVRITAKAGPGFNWLRYPEEESDVSDFALSGVVGLVGDYKIKSTTARKQPLKNLSYWGVRASILYQAVSYENTSGIDHLVMTLGISWTMGGGQYILR